MTTDRQPHSAQQPVYVYRGLHTGHPAMAAAKRGIIFPGNPSGSVTPEQHNLGGVSADSPYTSWSYSYEEAVRHATDRGAGGVILRLAKEELAESKAWHWQDSPNEFDEDEVLLLGIRIDAEVIFGA